MRPGGRALLAGAAVAVVIGLAAIAYLGSRPAAPSAPAVSALDPAQAPTFKDSKFPYKVGRPGPGQQAPPLRLPATDGNTFDLGSHRDGSTLLYFQEGIMCEPCWSQIKDIENSWVSLRSVGLARMVTVTTDPLDALQQKVADEHITFPVLSDADLSASRAFGTLGYGMMGANGNGHSFVLVGANGQVRWRADYGAPPHLYMFVPVPDLLTDLRKGLGLAPSP